MIFLRFAVVVVVVGVVGCTSEELPNGCDTKLFGSRRTIDRVEVTVESGPTGSDADVFLDIGLGGVTQTFDLDDSEDNFEAHDVDHFEFDTGSSFSFVEVTSMTLRVEEAIFATGPLDLEELTIWLDGEPAFHGRGPSPALIAGGSIFDTACPAPL
jgi:hypothetical protein